MNCINICYCADELYKPTLPSTISHLRKFYKDPRELKVHIITNQDIYLPGVETIKLSWRRSIAQLRVMIPSVIDSRCIYLDSDTTVTTCISKLWDTSFTGSTAMALSQPMPTCDIAGARYGIEGLMSLNREFYNTGVMLFDCDMWMSAGMSARCIDMFDTYKDTTSKHNDEPGINMAVSDCHTLDETWNYCPEVNTKYRKANIIHDYGTFSNGKPRHSLFNQ